MTVAELITKLTAYMSQEGNHVVQFVDGAVQMVHPDGVKQISDTPPPASDAASDSAPKDPVVPQAS